MWIPLIVIVLLTGLAIWRDPRQMKIAVGLLAVVIDAAMTAYFWAFFRFERWGERQLVIFVLASLLLMIGLIVVLGVVLVLNAVVMAYREGRRLQNLLGGLVGLLLLGFVVAIGVMLRTNSVSLFVWLLAIGFPASYLGYGFVAYLLYSRLYLRLTRSFAHPADAIVVLGSGLINDQVPPLLAARLDEGVRLYQRGLAAGKTPLFITSGGKGSDEVRPEAAAMAEYATGHGVAAGDLVIEDQSRNTEQNLTYSKALIVHHPEIRRVAVVTNSFHAFRAALLMRRAKIPGYASAAPTAGYFWPSAVIREYVAILRDHLVFNAIMGGMTLIPLVILLIGLLPIK